MIYFDHNSTTPVDPQVVESMLPFFSEVYGNAHSRSHAAGWLAEDAINDSRSKIAQILNVLPQEIFFTSGATESINLAIKGLIEGDSGVNKIISSLLEHKAVLDTLESLEKDIDIKLCGIDSAGNIDVEELKRHDSDLSLSVFMHVNNETGVVTDLESVKPDKGLFFVDATQSLGKLELYPKDYKINLMAFSSHKIYGPKGVGALFIDLETQKLMSPLIHGGRQERGLRSGTLNVPGIVGFASALELYRSVRDRDEQHIREIRDYFEAQISSKIDGIEVNGDSQTRIYNTSNIYIQHLDNEEVMSKIGARVAISNGSACTSATIEPSHVLLGMGYSNQRAAGSFRFSFGRRNTKEEVDRVVELLVRTVEDLRINVH